MFSTMIGEMHMTATTTPAEPPASTHWTDAEREAYSNLVSLRAEILAVAREPARKMSSRWPEFHAQLREFASQHPLLENGTERVPDPDGTGRTMTRDETYWASEILASARHVA